MNSSLAKRNLAIMWFANFFINGSTTMVLPFLSLYIGTLGHFSDQYIQHWSGLTFAVTFVTAFLVSPIWGRIGDKSGRKKILLFCAFGMAMSIFLMGIVTSVWQLFILRIFMGIFTGFISMSQAFISTQTPKETAGRVLGTLQTGGITGSLFGPMVGGLIADSVGYAAAFRWTSILIFICAVLVMFTKEFTIKTDTVPGAKSSYTSREVISFVLHKPVLLTVLLISTLVQVAHFSVQPILSLYVEELHGIASISFFAGIAFSAAGLGNLFMSRKWGKIGDSRGHIKVLLALLFWAGIAYLPGAFVTSFWQLVIVRFLLGIAIGGIIPVRIAYIRQEAPIAMQGEVLGYNTSLRFLGNIAGPLLGGLVAGYYGIPAVFITTSVLLLIAGLILYASLQRSHRLTENYSRSIN